MADVRQANMCINAPDLWSYISVSSDANICCQHFDKQLMASVIFKEVIKIPYDFID